MKDLRSAARLGIGNENTPKVQANARKIIGGGLDREKLGVDQFQLSAEMQILYILSTASLSFCLRPLANPRSILNSSILILVFTFRKLALTVKDSSTVSRAVERHARKEKIQFSIFNYICNQTHLSTNIEGKSSNNPPFKFTF